MGSSRVDRTPASMHTRVGLCGFTVAMRWYAERFPVVEVQRTFYDPPADAVMQRWRASTAPTLEYTMKVWQLVTHAATSPTYRRMKQALDPSDAPGHFRASAAVARGWQRSLECARLLDATAMLFQCPATFTPSPENVRNLRAFFERLERPHARLLWEPRGEAWVAERELALALCRDLGLVHVVDPFATPPRARGDVYWRLHGLGGARNSYDDDQLRTLATMLDAARNDEPAYVMFNNLPRVADASRFIAIEREPR
jgi:uncharacterized protein YecE (DUF72 family)